MSSSLSENMNRSLPPFSPPPPEPSNRSEGLTGSAFIAHLCDDTLLRILSYADLPSLIYFTRGTSNSLRLRFHPAEDCSSRCRDIWREAFANLHLAPIHEEARATRRNSSIDGDLPIPKTDHFNVIRRRLALWSTLCGNYSRRRKRTKQCFSLPSRLFHFVPLVPPDMMRYPPTSGGNNDDISFSYLDDDESDGDGEEDGDFEIDMDPNDNAQVDNDAMDHLGLMELDPPPVEFACDSFALTSPGTGGEFVILNPFSGSVEVYGSVLDNAISSDEGMMEQALLDASEGIVRKRIRGGNGGRRGGNERSVHHEEEDDEISEVIAGEAIDDRFQSYHRVYDTPPKQVLFSVNDYFDLDIGEYFGRHTPFASSGRRRGGNVTVDWVGVDSHLALKNDCKSIAGNIIGAARILNMESDREEDEELTCTEVLAWSNFDKDVDYACCGAAYGSKYVCRAAGSFYFLDICSNYRKVYASFQSGCCPFDENDTEASLIRRGDRHGRQLMDMEEESMVNEDGGPIRMSKAVYCLPLVEYGAAPTSCPRTIGSYFPSPDACFLASYPVSSFSVDATGKILVIGTICGTVEVWDTGMDLQNIPTLPLRLQTLSVLESFTKRHRSMTMDGRRTLTGGADARSVSADNDLDDKPINIEFDDNAAETRDDLALLETSALEEEEIPHKHPTTKVSQIYLPRHLPVQQCGFVTKQRSPESGTTLLLWQTPTMSSEKTPESIGERFQIVAMINVPLSAQCHPEVRFDGRRLVVFGKDHIGLIFLVYHVLGTRFDQREFDDVKSPADTKALKNNRGGNGGNGEESGGVVHVAGERRVRFANRIRHAGLDGLEYYDSMLLAANERFLVVNTKTGNLVGSDGARNAREGLLVIDLQEHGCC